MRFAYADPPYPGQAKRWYKDHPDYGGEVDHAELIGRLVRDYPDGWALSTNQVSLQMVLGLCPPGVRVAIWHNPRSVHPGAVPVRWWYTWEPVIVCGGRYKRDPGREPAVSNLLSCGAPSGWSGHKTGGCFPGRKPDAFARWVLDLLGHQDGDTIDDLFPGSGACSRVFAARAAQPMLGEEPAC